MKPVVTVREFARLTTAPVGSPSLDYAQVTATAFDWLCDINASFTRGGASLVQLEDRRCLRLDNFVGVVETPCGTLLEILPKHVARADGAKASRTLLRRMIAAALDLPSREAWETRLQLFDAPLNEWVMGCFLAALDHLIKRGIRSDYLRVESAERYLRGQLDAVRQLRQPPGREHIFNIRHDIYSPDRPENRLLKSAVETICRHTRSPENWRVAQEFRSLFEAIPASSDMERDFGAWRHDRLMAHYQPTKPWCELILRRQMPLALAGAWHGVSLLFPMEKLFERYVASALRNKLSAGTRLTEQAKGAWLCEHADDRIFRLEPDILIDSGERRWVLDTKWKRLDASNRANNYDLSRSDFFQLLAYGKAYLGGCGEMALIYPVCETFSEPLPVFAFDDTLKLHVLPFDLETLTLVGGTDTSLPLRHVRPATTERYDQPIAA